MLWELHEAQLIYIYTRAGGVGFILIVSTVVVTVTQPSQGDTAVVLALESLS